MILIAVIFSSLEDIHVFPENERTYLPEDTVHMQELRRLHYNDEHRRSHYRHPPGEMKKVVDDRLIVVGDC